MHTIAFLTSPLWHSSEIRGLRSMKYSSETLQNLGDHENGPEQKMSQIVKTENVPEFNI